ncbi:MAG: bifunctional DNA-formamidopyrimidine glycosylase/DNA-(apurinic or apyrimidinic site) lyase [Alphaproteobacteria bacterium]
MPELPEVETVASFLKQHLPGKKITAAAWLSGKKLRVNPNPLDWPLIIDQPIMAVERRGKNLLVVMANELRLFSHLGMSGHWLLLDKSHHYQASAHDHYALTLDSGQQLMYHDPRRFGGLNILSAAAAADFTQKLGLEPFDKKLQASWLFPLLQRFKKPIKNLLLQQELIAGIGNIYACEALFMAAIHPEKPANTVSLSECAKLIEALQFVLEKAIQAGGSSLKDYRGADGQPGYFQHQFMVYGRKNQPCGTCNGCGEQVQHIEQSGRSSWYCPFRQRLTTD